MSIQPILNNTFNQSHSHSSKKFEIYFSSSFEFYIIDKVFELWHSSIDKDWICFYANRPKSIGSLWNNWCWRWNIIILCYEFERRRSIISISSNAIGISSTLCISDSWLCTCSWTSCINPPRFHLLGECFIWSHLRCRLSTRYCHTQYDTISSKISNGLWKSLCCSLWS